MEGADRFSRGTICLVRHDAPDYGRREGQEIHAGARTPGPSLSGCAGVDQFVAAGEFNLGLVYENQVFRFKNQGAPLALAPLPFVTKNMHPLGLAAAAPHSNAGKLFVDFALSKEGQLLIKNLGRVVSRTDIPQDELGRLKMVAEDISIADRINQVMDEYKKYLE